MVLIKSSLLHFRHEEYQYSEVMLKHLPSDALKTISKTLLYDKNNQSRPLIVHLFLVALSR